MESETILSLNRTFNSYHELEIAKKNYESENNVQLWKRDARKIDNMQIKAPNKKYNHELVYQSIKFCCINCGKMHSTSSSGKFLKENKYCRYVN